MPTLYEVLALPSSSTRDEIRAAYWTQLARIRSGALPPSLEDLIEAAYATLDYPDRRVEYDLSLAAARQQRRRLTAARVAAFGFVQAAARRLRPSLPPLRLPSWRPLTSTAAIAVLCFVVFAVAYGLGRSSAGSTPAVARRTATPPVPAVQAIGEPPPSMPASPEATTVPPPVINQVPAAAADVPPAPSAQLQAAPPVSAARAESPSAASLAPQTPVVDTAASPGIVSTLRLTALVWSSPFTSAKVATHVWGRYCRDSSGGEIFTPASAPAPSLTC